MLRNHRLVGVGTILVLLFTLLASQLHAQSPSATPTQVTQDASDPTPLSLTTRQAVIKKAIDGDSFEIVFVDDGEVATVHLANVDAPESTGSVQCFGREAAAYVAQVFQDSPLMSVTMVGEIQDGEVFGYVDLPGGILLNRLVVLFGYARFDDQIITAFAADIEDAEQQSKLGKAGLWRACDATQQPPSPCFLFSRGGVDPASSRAFFVEHPDADEIRADFLNVAYDPIQNELVVMWELSVNALLSGWRMREFYRLSDCNRDRSESFNHRDSR